MIYQISGGVKMDDSTKKVLSRLDELDKKYEKKLDLICEKSNTIVKKINEASDSISELSTNLNSISNSCQRILEKLDKLDKLFVVQIILSIIISFLIGGFFAFVSSLV